jgi:WD40 repeat protein
MVATKKDHIARIYKVNNLTNINSWTFLQEIKDHTQTIGDVDWSADNKIVTSSHDRSVYVWRQSSESRWEKMLVNIDIKLSILVSKWAASTKKFALGSSCNTLALGFYHTT